MGEPTRIDFPIDRPGRVASMQAPRLRRLLGVKHLFAIGYGDVASSIYYALGVSVVFALAAAPFSLLIAGLFFVCTAATYSELATAMPEAGGSQLFARRAFNDLISFIAGWALLLDYILTISISAYAISPYLGYFWPVLKDPVVILAFASLVIIALCALNIVGIRESTAVSLCLASIDLVLLCGLSVIGLVYVFDWDSLMRTIHAETDLTVERFLYSLPIAMVAYTGIEAVSQLAGEAKDPGRKVPRAIFLTVIPVLFCAVALSATAVCLLEPMDFERLYVDDALAAVVEALRTREGLPEFARHLGPVVAVAGAIILLVATNAGVIGASRLAYSMASTYQVPPWVGRLSPRTRTPVFALCLFSGIAIVVLLIAKDLKTLADLYAFGAMMAFTLAHLSLIGLRIREPELERPFRSRPGIRIRGKVIPIPAVLGALATGGAWILVLVQHPAARDLGLAWCAIGFLIYFAFRRQARVPVVDRVAIDKVEVPEFHPLVIRRILVPTLGGRSTEVVQHACAIAKEFDAALHVLYVIEVPETLPLDTLVGDGHYYGNQALHRAEAIAREAGISTVKTSLVQSRRAGETIVEVAREIEADLVLLGAAPRPARGGTGSLRLPVQHGLSPTIHHVMSEAPCRVWVSSSRGVSMAVPPPAEGPA